MKTLIKRLEESNPDLESHVEDMKNLESQVAKFITEYSKINDSMNEILGYALGRTIGRKTARDAGESSVKLRDALHDFHGEIIKLKTQVVGGAIGKGMRV